MHLLSSVFVLSKHLNGTHSKHLNGTHSKHFNGSLLIHSRKQSKHRAGGLYNLTVTVGESSYSPSINENSYCLRPWPSLDLFVPVSFGHTGLVNIYTMFRSE